LIHDAPDLAVGEGTLLELDADLLGVAEQLGEPHERAA
jgi:hypothetical protein